MSVYLTFRLIFLHFVCYSYVSSVILTFFCYSYDLSVILTICLLFLRLVFYSHVLSVNLTFGPLILPSFTTMVALPGYRFSRKQFAKTLEPGFSYFYVLSVILTFCLLFLRFVCSFLRLYSTLTTYRLMVLLHVILLLLLLKLQFLLL